MFAHLSAKGARLSIRAPIQPVKNYCRQSSRMQSGRRCSPALAPTCSSAAASCRPSPGQPLASGEPRAMIARTVSVGSTSTMVWAMLTRSAWIALVFVLPIVYRTCPVIGLMYLASSANCFLRRRKHAVPRHSIQALRHLHAAPNA